MQLSPQAGGGAIFNRGGTVNATNCSFAGNTAVTGWSSTGQSIAAGGAIRNESGQVNLRSCAFVGNAASGGGAPPGGAGGYFTDPGFGGAIHNSGTVTVDLCTFANNSASGGNGGGYSAGYPGNSGGDGSGGAIWNAGTMTVDRSTLSGNTATGGCGGAGGPPPLGGTVILLTDMPEVMLVPPTALRSAVWGWLSVTRSTLVSNVGCRWNRRDRRQRRDKHNYAWRVWGERGHRRKWRLGPGWGLYMVRAAWSTAPLHSTPVAAAAAATVVAALTALSKAAGVHPAATAARVLAVWTARATSPTALSSGTGAAPVRAARADGIPGVVTALRARMAWRGAIRRAAHCRTR